MFSPRKGLGNYARIKPLLTNVLIVLASIAVALIAGEGICRLIGYPPSPRSGWQWAESAYKSEA